MSSGFIERRLDDAKTDGGMSFYFIVSFYIARIEEVFFIEFESLLNKLYGEIPD